MKKIVFGLVALFLAATSHAGVVIDRNDSQGTRQSKSQEQSNERRQDQSRQESYSAKLNLNPLLIEAYRERFEGRTLETNITMFGDPAFLEQCNTFSRWEADFPTLFRPKVYKETHPSWAIAPVEDNGYMLIGTYQETSGYGRGGVMLVTAQEGKPYAPQRENIANGFVGRYIVCRLLTHNYLKFIGNAIQYAINDGYIRPPKNINEARLYAQKVIEVVGNDLDQYQINVVVPATKTLENVINSGCSPFLRIPDKTTKSLECGPVKIEPGRMWVNGVPTLTESAIDGQSFEISLGMSQGQSRSASSSERSSRESSKESRKSMSGKQVK